MLKKYDYFNMSELSVPYDYNKKLRPNTERLVRQLKYSQIISSLMYEMSYTMLDTTFSIEMLSRFISNLEKSHWDVVQKLMRYLKETLNLSLLYTRFPVVIEGFSDASWCSEPDECRSTGGFVFTMGGGAISWKSKKQALIAQSLMESEFFALTIAGDEAEWLSCFP